MTAGADVAFVIESFGFRSCYKTVNISRKLHTDPLDLLLCDLTIIYMLSALRRSRMSKAAPRLSQMAAHISSSATHGTSSSTTNGAPYPGKPISQIPRSHTYTSRLTPDPLYSTPQISHSAPREDLGPRQVRGGFYTYCRPTKIPAPELLGVSPAAVKDLGISETESEEFLQVVSGNRILGWEEVVDGGEEDVGAGAEEPQPPSGTREELQAQAEQQQEGDKVYPWAQCYGGFQFGQWAGQLGDGRAISLFETRNPATGKRYELQLKGAGKTPYSRFADGRAVLRASIREFLVSEALNALGIRTTRALSLIVAERVKVRRERIEPAAIVARFAESWIRIGNFDILRARGDRKMIRQLSTYVAEEVLGGWEALAAALPEKADASPEETSNQIRQAYSHLLPHQILNPGTVLASSDIENTDSFAQNRFARMYRTIVRLNAATVAKWQLYGFMNGVLNSDNTSIAGLSLDFGPFAFIDMYDPSYTPNHDDHMSRYSYANQPSVIWWNLVRLGESLGELIGAGGKVDEEAYINGEIPESDIPEIQQRGETIIMRAGEEYKALVRAEFSIGLAARLGLKNLQSTDFDDLFTPWLDALQEGECDYNHAYRRLGKISLQELSTEEGRMSQAGIFFSADAKPIIGLEAAKKRLATWLGKYHERVVEDWGDSLESDGERRLAMEKVNPKVSPRFLLTAAFMP